LTEPSRIQRAIERGVAYLESVQLASGELPIEVSPTADMTGENIREPCVFPTALAARMLSITPAADGVRSRALDFLEREMHPDGLWRHPSSAKPMHYDTPLDVDDTSLASVALADAGRPVPNNRRFLIANRNRRGLFKTWIVRWWPHPLLTYRFFKYTTAERGDVDAVVIANVVVYLGDCEETKPSIAHLLEVLLANNESRSTKWYESRFTVWYFFSHALREIAPEAGEMIVPRVEAATPRNALELAAAISTLLLWNRPTDVTPLLDQQLDSGAWPRAGFYHMGIKEISPNVFRATPPWWGSEALTTMFAVEALARTLQQHD
jgi:hypothetical protein